MKASGILSGGLLAAILSSLCCITPVLALIAGTSSFAASFSWLEPVRPYLAGIAIAVLGFAWYQKLFPKRESQDCACEVDDTGRSFWQTKPFLGIITLFALAMLFFPHYAHVFYPHSEKQAIEVEKDKFKTAEFKITGMTCSGCAEHVMYEVNKLAGILKSDASYENASATVAFDSRKISLAEIENAINGTGYKVTDRSLR